MNLFLFERRSMGCSLEVFYNLQVSVGSYTLFFFTMKVGDVAPHVPSNLN
jgi:hypothetical protein